MKWSLFFFFLFLGSAASTAQEIQLQPTNYINDYVGMFGTADMLNRYLADFEKETSIEVAVVIINALSDYGYNDIESFSMQLAEQWKVGKKGVDNGVIYVIAILDRKDRIEVGYGLEPYLTDAAASEIVGSSKKRELYQATLYRDGIQWVVSQITGKLGQIPWTEREEMRKQQEAEDARRAAETGDLLLKILLGLGVLGGGAYGVNRISRKRKEALRKKLDDNERERRRILDEASTYFSAWIQARKDLHRDQERWPETEPFHQNHIKARSEALKKISDIYEPLLEQRNKFANMLIYPDTDLGPMNQMLRALDGPENMDCIFEYLKAFESDIWLCDKVDGAEDEMANMVFHEYDDITDLIEEYREALSVNDLFDHKIVNVPGNSVEALKRIKAEYDQAFNDLKVSAVGALHKMYNEEQLKSDDVENHLETTNVEFERLSFQMMSSVSAYRNFIRQVDVAKGSFLTLHTRLVDRLDDLNNIRTDMKPTVEKFWADNQQYGAIVALAALTIEKFYGLNADEQRLIRSFMKVSQAIINEARRKNNEDEIRRQKAEAERRRKEQEEEEERRRRRRNSSTSTGYYSTFGGGGFSSGGFSGGGGFGGFGGGSFGGGGASGGW